MRKKACVREQEIKNLRQECLNLSAHFLLKLLMLVSHHVHILLRTVGPQKK